MNAAKTVVCVIPARGGSKGVPKKNLRLLAGTPLLAHTLRHASAAACIGRTVVSTDDAEIAALARELGAGVVERPPELSTDDASSESAITHALGVLERERYVPDVVVFLQCTSPFRSRGDIDAAAKPVLAGEADSVLSVVPFHGLLWQREANGESRPVNFDPAKRPRRQEMPARYVENGSIYVFTRDLFQRTGVRLGGRMRLHVMHGAAALDIDTEEDLRLAEALHAIGGADWQ
jgi:CMP-N,N'-diacetyllegionaminic acid synthase